MELCSGSAEALVDVTTTVFYRSRVVRHTEVSGQICAQYDLNEFQMEPP